MLCRCAARYRCQNFTDLQTQFETRNSLPPQHLRRRSAGAAVPFAWQCPSKASLDNAVVLQYELSMPRFTIDFDEEFDKTLSELVKTTDATTKADVIRRAVASYSYLKKQQRQQKDSKLRIVDKDDKPLQEIVLP